MDCVSLFQFIKTGKIVFAKRPDGLESAPSNSTKKINNGAVHKWSVVSSKERETIHPRDIVNIMIKSEQ